MKRFGTLTISDLATIAGFALVAAICSGLDVFASYFLRGGVITQLLFVIVMFAALTLATKLRVNHKAMTRLAPLALWIVVIAALIFIPLFGASSPKASMAPKLFLSTVLTLLIGALFYILQHRQQVIGRLALGVFLLGYLLATIAVIVDPVVDLRAMVPSFEAELYERSRAGGLYLQPNIASAVLPILYLAVAPRVSRLTASVLTVFLLMAIVLTFSRAGLLISGIVMGVAVLSGRLPRWPLVVVGVVLLGFGGFVNIPELLIETFDISEGSGFNRLTNIDQFLTFQAAAQDSRSSLAMTAFYDFLKEPMYGLGPGYSWEWAEAQPDQVGTHNIFLRYMLEYGILGFFIWPGLMLCLYHLRHPDLPRYWANTIFVTSMLIGFFSHNLPEQGAVLMTVLCAYALPVRSRTGHVRQRGLPA